jgi:hypothetical protein
MSSDDSKNKRNNATVKSGRQGYFPKRVIRVTARVVRGNKTICKGMRDETRVAQKRGCRS